MRATPGQALRSRIIEQIFREAAVQATSSARGTQESPGWIRREWVKPGGMVRVPSSDLRFLPDNEAVEALIPCMRQSAQEIVAALGRNGIVLSRRD